MQPEMSFHKKVNYFMFPFMYELEKILIERKSDLKTISYHADEANTDKEQKEYIKKIINENLVKLPDLNKEVHIDYIDTRNNLKKLDYTFFKDIFIKKIYLPEEITVQIKDLVKRDNVMYADPDILLEITNKESTHYVPIELKSTKKNTIPGSSVQQVIPYEWVIFIKHNKKEVSITTGQYINSINSTMQFPDRSPRPSVSFSELEKWNNDFRSNTRNESISEKEILSIKISSSLLNDKLDLIDDWQGTLVNRWLNVVLNDTVSKTEPWFNYTIRRYTLDFIDYYKNLSANDKNNLEARIKNNIDLDDKNNK